MDEAEKGERVPRSLSRRSLEKLYSAGRHHRFRAAGEHGHKRQSKPIYPKRDVGFVELGMSDETKIPAQRRRRQSEIEQILAGLAERGLHRSEFCRRHSFSRPRAEHQTRRGDERH